MSLVTKMAPDFTAAAVMPDNAMKDVTLSSFRGKYVLLFFYPMDFTFVCPSEILAFNSRLADVRKLNCQVIGVSCDTEYTHFAWKSVDPSEGGIGAIAFPLVADKTKQIARDYGILFGDSVALRGLFLIDTKGVVRHELVNDLSIGRSVDEAIRTLEALQFTEKYGDVCPANWHPGEDAMEPSAKGVAAYLAKHVK